MIPQKRPLKDVVLDHLWGPTGSFLFHALLVLVLIKFVTFEKRPVVDTVQIMRIDPKMTDVPPPEPVTPPDDNRRLIDDSPHGGDLLIDEPSVDVEPPSEPEAAQSAPQNFILTSPLFTGPIIINTTTTTRSADERNKRMAEFGANPATKQALVRALEFLKAAQAPNGSWENSVGMTGLGLLTFLAHGETPSTQNYGPVVENAMLYLLAAIQEDGRFKAEGGHAYVYHHALGAYALAEAYGMTRIPALKSAVENVTRVIVGNQLSGGGWSYGYDRQSDRNDSSVAAWQIQALKAASIAGIRLEGLPEALQKAPTGLQELYLSDSGNFGYSTQNKRSNIGLTGLGVLCHQLLGRANDPVVKNGLRALRDATANWGAQNGWPLYSWYYVTQAKFHAGGDPWKRWNAMFAPALLKNQSLDGSWVSPGESEMDRGKVYGTTFAALTLQVYYRILPTFQERATTVPSPSLGNGDVEIHLDI